MSSLSSSQDSFKTAPEFQPPEPLTQYVHVFEGNNSTNTRYLFVKNLGTDGIYQSQLVLQQLRAGVFKPAVRMVYRRRTFRDEPSSHSYFDRLHDNNLAVTRYLYCGLLDLRVPLPYFENHFVRGNKVTRASYWSFANGGSLGRLLENMGATAKQPAVSNFSPRQEKRSGLSSQTGLTEPACVEKLRNLTLSNPGTRGLPPFPRHLALHLLYQLLETLEKMYNHPRGAVFHTNITAETLHLHFEESNDLPDLILTNFSHAVIAPFSKKATWDIPSVLSLILKHLPELNDFISPLQTLHDAFLRNRQAATPNPSGQYTYTIPSLAPLLAEFQAATPSCSASDSENPRLPWIREMADFHDEAYLAPQAYNTIDAILDTTGIHGPWRVGEFDPMTGMAIVPVPFAPGEQGYMQTTYHRPNSSNSSSDTEDSDVGVDMSEYVMVSHRDWDEDEIGYGTGGGSNVGTGNKGLGGGVSEGVDDWVTENAGVAPEKKQAEKGLVGRLREVGDLIWPRAD